MIIATANQTMSPLPAKPPESCAPSVARRIPAISPPPRQKRGLHAGRPCAQLEFIWVAFSTSTSLTPLAPGDCGLGECMQRKNRYAQPHASDLTPDAQDLAKRPQIPNPRGTAIQHQRCRIIVEHPTKLKALAP